MKILPISDLHLELAEKEYALDLDGYDALFLLGDIHTKGRSISWIKKQVEPDFPVFYVLGNHEYYQGHIRHTLCKMKEEAKGYNIKILENETAHLDGYRIIGATGWSSFKAAGEHANLAILKAEEGRNLYSAGVMDYRYIKTGSYKKIRAYELINKNLDTYNYLKSELGRPYDGRTVVMTHHAPSIQSLPGGKIEDILDASDVNTWEDLITEHSVDFWFHGHIHHKADYLIGKTRIINNPFGYPKQFLGCNEKMIVDLSEKHSATNKLKI